MNKIGVVGAGNMGVGIAQKYAMSGLKVTVVDLSEDSLNRGKKAIEHSLNQAFEKKIISEKSLQLTLKALQYSTSLESLSDCNLIVEAIFEDLEVKRELFCKLEKLCPNSILATNTSSFTLEDIAENLEHPENFLGLHYFYHPAKNKLVEVIPHKHTTKSVIEKAYSIQEACGKLPIFSKDAPGFIVNRFFVPWLNESVRLLEEQVTNIATIEAAAKKSFGIGMGPFELMNITGIPITLHAANALATKLGRHYKPCPLIEVQIKSGSQWDLEGKIEEEKLSTVTSRLMAAAFKEALQLSLTEGVGTIEDVDLGARVGLLWKKGPFELMNETGLTHVSEMLSTFSKHHDAPTPAVPDLAEFPMQWVTTEFHNSVGIIQFNRPDTMNALNETVIEQLKAAFMQLESDDSVEGIVVTGRGKAFVAGADTHYFVENMKANNIGRIVEFAKGAQSLFEQMENSKKKIVCAMNGLALGGGLELALACDYVVAADTAMVGFPETGIGIYPGLGGTQRTPRRVGLELARWLVLSGEMLKANKALEINLVDELTIPNATLSRAIEIAGNAKKTTKSKLPPSDNIVALKNTFSEPLPKLLSSQKRLNFKAPAALKAADELLALSQKLSLSEGLSAESNRLFEIFSSKDALIGLSSVGKRERPEFRGN